MKNPTTVIFIGPPLEWNGKPINLVHSEEVDYDDVRALITEFKNLGGVFLEKDRVEKWFLPWPCAVYIRPMNAIAGVPPTNC